MITLLLFIVFQLIMGYVLISRIAVAAIGGIRETLAGTGFDGIGSMLRVLVMLIVWSLIYYPVRNAAFRYLTRSGAEF